MRRPRTAARHCRLASSRHATTADPRLLHLDAQWMDAIERAALAVSKLFKDSNDREVHAAQATRAIQKYAPPVTPGSSGQPIAARAGGATPKSRSTSKNKKDRPSVRV